MRLTMAGLVVLLALSGCDASSGSSSGGGSGSTGGGSGTTGGGSGGTGGGAASSGGGATGGGSGGSAGGGMASGGGTASSGGGTADACSTDAGFNVASRCSCPGFTLCENFEGASIDTTTWTVNTNQTSTAAIESTRFARGAKALHIHVPASAGAQAILSETKSFPATGNSFWGRSFVYVDGKAPKVHTGVFEGSGTLGGSTAHVRLGFDNGEIRPNYLLESPTKEYGAFTQPPTLIPTGKWSCFEWHYNGATNALEFFLDEQEMVENRILSTTTPPWTMPTFSAFELGLLLYQNDTATAAAFDVWFDEVALANNRIGCGH